MSKVPDQAELYRRQAQSALDKLEATKKKNISTSMGETAEYWYKRWVASYDLANANADKFTVEVNLHKQTKAALIIAQGMKQPTFKVGDRIKVNEKYAKGRSTGKLGTIIGFRSYHVVKMDNDAELLLLDSEMELVKEDLYCGKTAAGWCTENDITVGKLADAKQERLMWEKRALEAEQKLKELTFTFKKGDRVKILKAGSFSYLVGKIGTYEGKDSCGQDIVTVDGYGYPAYQFCGEFEKVVTVDFTKPIKFSKAPVFDTIGIVAGQSSKIGCIKELRELTGWGLKEAKDFSEGKPILVSVWVSTLNYPLLQALATKYGVTIVQA